MKRWFLILSVLDIWIGYTRWLTTFQGFHGMRGWHARTFWMRFAYEEINGTEKGHMGHIYHDGSYEKAKAAGWLW